MSKLPKLANGDEILDYRICGKIGEGGFGHVFLAQHEVLERQVAIKVPKDSESLSTLRTEGVIQAKLQHPNIVKTLEMSMSHDPAYVVMEYVEGSNLKEVLRGGALPWKRAVNIALQIASGLQHAHEHGYIHGDVKPSNILVPEDQTRPCKVTDFGLGREFEAAAQSLQISRSLTLAQAGAELMGTLTYLAPEVKRGENPDEHSDIYSLGFMLFEMLTGSWPEGCETPSDFCDHIPDAIDELFSRCYVRKSKRYKSMAEVTARLKSILNAETSQSVLTSKSSSRSVAANAFLTDVQGSIDKPKGESETVEAATLEFQDQERETPAPSESDATARESCEPADSAELNPSACWIDREREQGARRFRNMTTDVFLTLSAEFQVQDRFQAIESHGFDLAFGVADESEPQHRLFALSLPSLTVESTNKFVETATSVFEAEKGLWEKEVTFVIMTESIQDRAEVDWILKTFSTGWWRRRRTVVFNSKTHEILASQYGCDPYDNSLKDEFLKRLQATTFLVQLEDCYEAEQSQLRAPQNSKIGTMLTVFSTFCVIAVGLTSHSINPKTTATKLHDSVETRAYHNNAPSFQAVWPQFELKTAHEVVKTTDDKKIDGTELTPKQSKFLIQTRPATVTPVAHKLRKRGPFRN